MLVELACAATLAPAYIPGLLQAIMPKIGKKRNQYVLRNNLTPVCSDNARRPVVVFIVCGGSKILLSDVEKYHAIVQKSGEAGLHTARQQVMIDTKLGLDQ
jgi:hypothetical protein